MRVFGYSGLREGTTDNGQAGLTMQANEGKTPLRSHRELMVWQVAFQLVQEIYRLTNLFPKAEQFGLIAQMRRAAISVPANIAEGYGRRNRPEYIQFLSIAGGSLAELDTYVALAKTLGMASQDDFESSERFVERANMLLCRLRESLKRTPARQHPPANPQTRKPADPGEE